MREKRRSPGESRSRRLNPETLDASSRRREQPRLEGRGWKPAAAANVEKPEQEEATLGW